jgi:hypothetical protein
MKGAGRGLSQVTSPGLVGSDQGQLGAWAGLGRGYKSGGRRTRHGWEKLLGGKGRRRLDRSGGGASGSDDPPSDRETAWQTAKARAAELQGEAFLADEDGEVEERAWYGEQPRDLGI